SDVYGPCGGAPPGHGAGRRQPPTPPRGTRSARTASRELPPGGLRGVGREVGQRLGTRPGERGVPAGLGGATLLVGRRGAERGRVPRTVGQLVDAPEPGTDPGEPRGTERGEVGLV